jgi:hypothetical protein
VGVDAEIPLPADDPFLQDEAPCRVDRDPAGASVVRGPAPKAAAKGPLTLRLRDVDLADVFAVLHSVTSHGFLVDGDVAGRVSVDLSQVTLEEALGALEKAGVRSAEAGPVRRIVRAHDGAPPAPAPAAGNGGASASFSLKRADVRELLAVMSEADPGLAALGPQGFLGRVSLWARDVPLIGLRAAVLDSAGLKERTEEDRRILARTTGADDPVFPVAGAAPDRRLVLRPQDLALQEFELAGLASAGESWVAFAYSPTGALNAYRAGDRLADAVVQAVESTDVLLETDEGPLRVPISPLPR